ncbi:MAG: 6-hydroxymethylpterin diphosphokinase MptE-like protein [Promethearchaeota archaeon]
MEPNWIYFREFRKTFISIQNSFGFDPNKEIIARNQLFQILRDRDPTSLIGEITQKASSRTICFFGAGPNLPDHLRAKISVWLTQREIFYIVAADGSANALMEKSLIPDLIVSDLDGLSYGQMEEFLGYGNGESGGNGEGDGGGGIVVVLAHGDNSQALETFAPLFSKYERIIGTTQAPAVYPVLNPGGFTDGDRGLFLIHHLVPLVQPFYLFGYEFGATIGKYSKNQYLDDQPMAEMKRKKLNICRDLIHQLSTVWARSVKVVGIDQSIQMLPF